jgi:hypothetical protein
MNFAFALWRKTLTFPVAVNSMWLRNQAECHPVCSNCSREWNEVVDPKPHTAQVPFQQSAAYLANLLPSLPPYFLQGLFLVRLSVHSVLLS